MGVVKKKRIEYPFIQTTITENLDLFCINACLFFKKTKHGKALLIFFLVEKKIKEKQLYCSIGIEFMPVTLKPRFCGN